VSSRSGAEIRKALFSGEPVTWGFNPKEKRVVLTLPKHLGGRTYELCIAGSYTFVARFTGDGIPDTVSNDMTPDGFLFKPLDGGTTP
jgi:hypothetical protein